MKSLEWAKGAVEKHGWKHALRIALQCQKLPNLFFQQAEQWIKRHAPPGAFDEN